MDRARLRRYDPPYRVLPITQPSPEGDGRALLDIETRSANSLERIARLGAGVGCTRDGRSWRTSFLQGIVRCSIA
jgi:hypothetical protein